MAGVRKLVAEGWAPSVSVLLHGLALVALVIAVEPPTFPTSHEQAVPVTLAYLAPVLPVATPAPAPAPPPVAIDEPPPITTTAHAAEDIAPPPPKPVRKHKPRPKPEARTSPSSPVPAPDPVVAPPIGQSPPSPSPIGPTAESSQSVGPSPSYLALLRQKLERNKVYPHIARARREQGTALLRFVVDRNGHVLTHRLERSSGHSDLDREVEAMLERAQPLPPMPSEMTQAQLELVVPVQFHLR